MSFLANKFKQLGLIINYLIKILETIYREYNYGWCQRWRRFIRWVRKCMLASFSKSRFAFAANRINILYLPHQHYIQFILVFKGILNFIAIILVKFSTLTCQFDHVMCWLEIIKFNRKGLSHAPDELDSRVNKNV